MPSNFYPPVGTDSLSELLEEIPGSICAPRSRSQPSIQPGPPCAIGQGHELRGLPAAGRSWSSPAVASLTQRVCGLVPCWGSRGDLRAESAAEETLCHPGPRASGRVQVPGSPSPAATSAKGLRTHALASPSARPCPSLGSLGHGYSGPFLPGPPTGCR